MITLYISGYNINIQNMDSIKKKTNEQKMYTEALYRAFDESEDIMVSYPESSDTRSKMTLIHEILTKKY